LKFPFLDVRISNKGNFDGLLSHLLGAKFEFFLFWMTEFPKKEILMAYEHFWRAKIQNL